MPLIKSGSKKAFKKNVEREMKSGKPQDQALAIAYSVKRKNRKKMAEGGKVNESAATEHRPMPEERDKDAKMVSQNSEKKALVDAQATSRPDIKQSTRGMRTTPIKHPKMVPSKGFTAKLRDQEDDLQSSAGVNNGPQRQPPQAYDEEDADKEGPSVPALNMKMMAAGGEVEHQPKAVEVIGSPGGFGKIIIIKHKQEDKPQMAEGGVISAVDEKRAMPDDEHNDSMEISHNRAKEALHAGEIMHPMDDMDQFDHQPSEEAEEEKHASIAAAIMAKRQKMADGGIASHKSIYADDSSQVDLSRNADEDANEEDQLSFNALRKENYSESEGLRQLNQPNDSNLHGDEIDSDDHDMVSSIRRKMAMKRASK